MARTKATTCIGQTRAELEATVIAMQAQYPNDLLPGTSTVSESAAEAIAQMLASGFLKLCSVHPDHYIVNRKLFRS